MRTEPYWLAIAIDRGVANVEHDHRESRVDAHTHSAAISRA
jgi:hypothetical protein